MGNDLTATILNDDEISAIPLPASLPIKRVVDQFPLFAGKLKSEVIFLCQRKISLLIIEQHVFIPPDFIADGEEFRRQPKSVGSHGGLLDPGGKGVEISA